MQPDDRVETPCSRRYGGVTVPRDEIRSFCYSKWLTVPYIMGDPEWAGDVWAWTAIEADRLVGCGWAQPSRRRDLHV